MKKKIIDLGALYVGKVGALAVGFFLMPAYSLILGPSQFATVAFILSLVNAAVTLDFGMSTIIGRDASDNTFRLFEKYKQLRASILIVIIFYTGVFLLTIAYDLLAGNQFNEIKIQIYSLILILSSLVQNISVSYLNGIKEFKISGFILFFSVTLRGVISLIAIKYYENSLVIFMLVQASLSLFFAVLFIWLTRVFSNVNVFLNSTGSNGDTPSELWYVVKKLAKKGLPLLFMGFSATLVMQLDKLALAHYAPKEILSAYYLAFTFSTIPILAVAGPIKQYFQPHIVSSLTGNDYSYKKNSVSFFWCLIIFVAIPSAAGYSFLKPIISLWLGNNVLVNQVVAFSLVLLPAFTIGALSYYPSVLLIVAEDYKFQSCFAIFTSAIFAIAVLFACLYGYFFVIPWLFIVYFLTVITFFSLRCIKLKKISICFFDVIKHFPLAMVIVACAYGIGYVLSILIH